MLLVPGVVKDSVTYEQCYERSQAEIKKLLPLAAERKIKIGIETVTMENLVLQIIVLKNAAPD